MTTLKKTKVAIIGSGNIGTDLMIKVIRKSKGLEMGAMVGIDPDSDGLARAKRMGIATTHEGIDGLVKLDVWPEIGIVFDATSAGAHKRHNEVVTSAGKVMIDLTPAAIGPYVIPVVNGDAHLDASNVNMRRAGDDPNRGSSSIRRDSPLCGDRRFHRLQVSRAGNAGQH